ncbi:MAG TPA: hypothetical protein VNK07_00090 [Candidatus Binatia bacterium]|jgi:hypothetical protein|nr:hypothetical protein [Candidatus Binatia bacterium]
MFTQDDDSGGILKTEKGILIVWNEPNNNYTIEVKGNDIRPFADSPLIFYVDKKILQIKTVAKKEFVNNLETAGLDDKSILIAHRDWEVKYLSSLFKQSLKIDSAWQKLTNGVDALLWNFEMPSNGNSQAKKQVFLVISKGDYILLLNSAVTDSIDEKTVRQFLLETIETLKINKKPLSLKKAQEQILNGDN